MIDLDGEAMHLDLILSANITEKQFERWYHAFTDVVPNHSE